MSEDIYMAPCHCGNGQVVISVHATYGEATRTFQCRCTADCGDPRKAQYEPETTK